MIASVIQIDWGFVLGIPVMIAASVAAVQLWKSGPRCAVCGRRGPFTRIDSDGGLVCHRHD